MFRTRDFLLVFTTIVFLITAIGLTAFQKSDADTNSADIEFSTQIVSDEEPIVLANEELSRSERLESMREKIAAQSQLSMPAVEAPPEVVVDTATTSGEGTIETNNQPLLCGNYAASQVAWSPYGVQIEEVEGARLVYVEIESQEVSASGTVAAAPVVERDVRLQLPVRTYPVANPSCISSDVIGIANDGSLIRNSEASVYGIFDSTTVVGYALDGFPIYGAGATPTDVCGGVMGAAGYQYQISPQRDTIINCFSAPPVQL